MSDGVLPQRVNTRKAVGREATYAGHLGVAQLPDFAGSVCAAGDSPVHARLHFRRDEDGRAVLDVALDARVRLECQRCLGWFTRELRSESRLALVAGDDQARQLPSEYEPLISGEDTDLWSVVAEELALAMPVVAYHPDGVCTLAVKPSGSETDTEGADRTRPFEVLSALLDQPADDKDDSKNDRE